MSWLMAESYRNKISSTTCNNVSMWHGENQLVHTENHASFH